MKQNYFLVGKLFIISYSKSEISHLKLIFEQILIKPKKNNFIWKMIIILYLLN